MSGWKFKSQLRENSLGYTGRTTMDNDRPLAERVARLEAALAQLTDRYERGATEPTDPPGTQCGEPSPHTGNKCQEIEGHVYSHMAGIGDMWERTEPKHPSTWTAGDPKPPGGTIIARDGWRALTMFGGRWTGLDEEDRYEDAFGAHWTVLRWGWEDQE